MFAILQKYDFSSKSQLFNKLKFTLGGCLRYCKSTIFQANHNYAMWLLAVSAVVCDTAKVRFFKQITTPLAGAPVWRWLFAILQKYDFSSKSQLKVGELLWRGCCLRYCKSTIFQANHNALIEMEATGKLFAILQKYDFSSKSQPKGNRSTLTSVVCDTAKVRFFKQITTKRGLVLFLILLFAILQKYDFSSKSQPVMMLDLGTDSCLRYCKSTIFQANHN